MTQKRIRIKIDQLGTATIEAEGYTGNDCQAATAGLEAVLGGTAKTDLKPEYYTEGGEDQQQHQSW